MSIQANTGYLDEASLGDFSCLVYCKDTAQQKLVVTVPFNAIIETSNQNCIQGGYWQPVTANNLPPVNSLSYN